MKKALILIIVFFCLRSTVFCQQSYWQQQVDYKINVSLNDANNTLDGHVDIDYYNNSPDTLHFIWIQLWANAFKNDRTAYSDQLLENGRTDFYFSTTEQRGYINRLNFKVNDITALTEEHPKHPDLVKLLLPQPLAPNSHIKIETPFHVKLPYNFSGDGYQGRSYQITQWYPKPAVYDSKGWHEMPYLSQGGSYNEFGNYKVTITLSGKYIVAATGNTNLDTTKSTKPKTWEFEENNITDFVWFADKGFIVTHDTIQSTGKIIDVFVYRKAGNSAKWDNSIKSIKDAITIKSNLIGDYPYNSFSIVENTCLHNEAMSFINIGLMKPSSNKMTMDFFINHLVGYSWFGGALASNQRQHPWMDKGMNTYYDDEVIDKKNETYLQLFDIKRNWIYNKLPNDPRKSLLEEITNTKTDQPIETPADSFSLRNYYMIGYVKTAKWLSFAFYNSVDTIIKKYYKEWEFKHPYPEDFKNITESVTQKNTDTSFSFLNKKGWIGFGKESIFIRHNSSKSNMEHALGLKKDTRLTFLFNFKDADKHNYICLSPAIGYNYYDQFMLGGLVHNYTIPQPKFEYVLSPLYSVTTKKWNGIGRLSYSFYPNKTFSKININLSGSSFTTDQFIDTGGSYFYSFRKIVPGIRFTFKEKNPRSTITRYIQFKTFIINEQAFAGTGTDTLIGIDTSYKQVAFGSSQNRVLNQLLFVIENNRVLYPYRGELKAEQGSGFIRLGFTGNYYFNYTHNKGGAAIRLYAGKFIYTTNNVAAVDPYNIYQLNLSAPKGNADYTYSNYFIARNYTPFNTNTPNWKFPYQQIMMADGGFKINTSGGGANIGASYDWVASLNGTFDIPKSVNPLSVLPFKIPLKAFVDIGTNAQAWQTGGSPDKFLYDAGLQLSLLKGIVNIYVPILYSQEFSDYNASYLPQQNLFFKTITFSIDIQNFRLNKFIPQVQF